MLHWSANYIISRYHIYSLNDVMVSIQHTGTQLRTTNIRRSQPHCWTVFYSTSFFVEYQMYPSVPIWVPIFHCPLHFLDTASKVRSSNMHTKMNSYPATSLVPAYYASSDSRSYHPLTFCFFFFWFWLKWNWNFDNNLDSYFISTFSIFRWFRNMIIIVNEIYILI